MKLMSPSHLLQLLLVVVLLMTLAVEAQFPFRLPSPPRILFGGFRPLFSRRPRPQQQQRPTFQPQTPPQPPQQFVQQNLIAPPSQFRRPPPIQQVFLRRPPPRQLFPRQPVRGRAPAQGPAPDIPAFQPPPPPQRPQPQPPRPPPPLPPQIPSGPQASFPTPGAGFGSPKPETVIQDGRPQTFPNINQDLLTVQQPQQQFINNNNIPEIPPQTLPPSRPPQTFIQDNNIIGMSPPPLPAPLPPPSPAPVVPNFLPDNNFRPPPSAVTPRPVVPTTAVSNALEDLLINPVPSVNAGVLPLANEQPAQLQFFPPLSRQRRRIKRSWYSHDQ